MNQQMDNQLPEGWVEASLGELNQYQASTVQPEKFAKTTFELYSVPAFPEKIPEILQGESIGSSKQLVLSKDVLICKINPRINRVWVVKDIKQYQQIASSEWIVFRQPALNERYFGYYFQSLRFRNLLCADVTGVGGSLTRAQPKKVATFELPLPPLAEQHYLADKLDSLLVRIQALSDQLAAVPALLKQFRQSVLADAVSGKLTAEWREENQEAFPQMVTIAEVADFSLKKQKLDDDLPVSFSSMHYMSEKTGAALGFEEKKWGEVKKGFTYFENNDVLLAKITPCFENGKTAVARNLINGIGTGSTEFMVMRPNEGLLPDYLLFNINTNNFRRDGTTNMTGSVGHKRVPKDFVENWPILLPSLAEQTEIVRRVETLFALADDIEQQSRAAAERVALLTQSVLAKAFRGELSEAWRREHPDLISGDNSAAALLAHIQAERAATGKTSRRA